MFADLAQKLPFFPRRRRGLKAFLRREDGGVAIEYAMVALPFLGLIFSIVQTAIVFMAQQQLETVAEQASRQLLTGQAQLANLTQAQFLSSVCSQISALFGCGGLMVDVQTSDTFSDAVTSAPTLTYNAKGQVTNTWNYSTGGPGSIIVMRVMYQWPLVKGPLSFNLANLPNGDRLLMATAVLQTEPYQ